MDKILIVYGSLNSVPSPEGAAPAKVIVDTVKHLEKERFVVLSNHNDTLDPTTFDHSIFQHIKPNWVDKVFLFLLKLRFRYREKKEQFVTAQDSQLLYFIAASRFIKRNGYKKAIIHVSVGLVQMVKFFNPKCELVFYHHGTSLHSKLSETQWERLLKNTVAIFGVNQAAATMANAHFNTKIPSGHYYKIANGVDRVAIPENCEPETDSFKILFSGRICKEKGVLELIKAYKILTDNGHNVELLIAGPAGINRGKTEAEKYVEVCNKFILSNNLKVRFLGNLQQSKLYDFYKIVNVVILPTDPKVYAEGMSLSLLEAMSMGKPLIATNAGGNPEVIEDGYNGFLIYADNNYAEEIAEKIELIYLNKNLERKMTVNAIDRYKANFTTIKMSENFKNALDQIGFI